jgi:hypothetical protein
MWVKTGNIMESGSGISPLFHDETRDNEVLKYRAAPSQKGTIIPVREKRRARKCQN